MSYPISNVFYNKVQAKLMDGLKDLGSKSRISHILAVPAVAIDGIAEGFRLPIRSIEDVVNAIFQILGTVVGRGNCSIKQAIGHVESTGHNAVRLVILPVKLLYNTVAIAWNPAQNARSVAFSLFCSQR